MHIIPIDSLHSPDAPQAALYAQRSETQLMHACEPHPGLFVAESPNVICRALEAGYEPVSFLAEEAQLKDDRVRSLLERSGDVPVYAASPAVFRQLIGAAMTRGLLCMMHRRPVLAAHEICAGCRRIAVLEDVVNPTNLGAIFRSAAALGVDAVLLTKGCTDPLYRRCVRVSMGTVFQIPWAFLPEGDWLSLLHRLGFTTAAMCLREDTLDIDTPLLRQTDRLAVVLGTEGEGLHEETIRDCQYAVRIPMSHGVDSLNVAAAAAVAFWALCR